MQLVINGNSHLPGIAPIQKGLVGIVWRDQLEIKTVLGVMRIEQVVRPKACGPRAVAVTRAQILQVVRARCLRVAGVVVEAAEGRGV